MVLMILSLSRHYPCWDAVLHHLDFDSIKHLRLANRQLAASCFSPWFTRHIETKTIELIPDDKGKALSALCEHPLSAYVKRLNIVTNIYDTSVLEQSVQWGELLGFGPLTLDPQERPVSGDIEDWRRRIQWIRERRAAEGAISDEVIVGRLAEAFKALKSLRGVSLDARFRYGPDVYRAAFHMRDWPLVRGKATWLFDLVVAAIADSGVRMEDFDGYRDSPGCAISIDSLATSLRRSGNEGTGPWDAIRDLSLRICKRPEEGHDGGDSGNPRRGTWTDVLDRLLRACGDIECLSIHVYDPPGEDEFVSIAPFLATQLYTKHLKRCALRHLKATPQDLSQFLSCHPCLEHLELSRITLTDGNGDWQSILSEIPQQLPNLQTLKLCRLQTSVGNGYGAMQSLETTWMNLREKLGKEGYERAEAADTVPCDTDLRMWHTMTFSAEDLRKGLQLSPAPGRYVESPQSYYLTMDGARERRPYHFV